MPNAQQTADFPLLRGLAETRIRARKNLILEERYANEIVERFGPLASEAG